MYCLPFWWLVKVLTGSADTYIIPNTLRHTSTIWYILCVSSGVHSVPTSMLYSQERFQIHFEISKPISLMIISDRWFKNYGRIFLFSDKTSTQQSCKVFLEGLGLQHRKVPGAQVWFIFFIPILHGLEISMSLSFWKCFTKILHILFNYRHTFQLKCDNDCYYLCF